MEKHALDRGDGAGGEEGGVYLAAEIGGEVWGGLRGRGVRGAGREGGGGDEDAGRWG